jgi:hypothetical protein
MFIGAHLFAGALLGLGFWYLTNDRRAVPFCVGGSILPDLVDKSLGLLVPSVLGGGRTVFHTLMIIVVIMLCTLIFVRSTSRWLGAGVACAVLLHEVFDEMWTEPANWFWPLLGPFQGQMIPGYLWAYFWYEITNPSEWLFMTGTAVILLQSYQYPSVIPRILRSDRLKTGACTLFAGVFLVTGLYLIIAGFTRSTATCITPNYSGLPTVIAGVLALCGTLVMSREIGCNLRYNES